MAVPPFLGKFSSPDAGVGHVSAVYERYAERKRRQMSPLKRLTAGPFLGLGILGFIKLILSILELFMAPAAPGGGVSAPADADPDLVRAFDETYPPRRSGRA